MSKNLATTTVATAPSPATSGTSLTVATGTGSRLYDGMAVLHPAGAVPTTANAEVVSITVSGDVVTLTRAQESSTARTVVVGDILTQGITAAMWDTLVASNAGKAAASHVHSAADVTSGTLPLARGGTGGADAAGARASLGLGSAATMTPATIAADPALAATYAPLAPDWITARAYVVGELVVSSGTLYRCVTAHTSGGSINLANFAALGGASSAGIIGGGRSGDLYGYRASFGAAALSYPTGREHAVPLVLPTGRSISGISIRVETAAPSGVARIGWRADDDGWPGALVQELGTVSTAATGTVTLSAPFAPAAGVVFWITLAAQVATPSLRSDAVAVIGGKLEGSPMPADALTAARITPIQDSVTGALPATFSTRGLAANVTTSLAPLILVTLA